MKNKEKWLYMGLIPEQKVLKVRIDDLPERMKLLSKGYVFSTKEAYENQSKGKVFLPTTHAGITIYSHVQYSAGMIKALQHASKIN